MCTVGVFSALKLVTITGETEVTDLLVYILNCWLKILDQHNRM